MRNRIDIKLFIHLNFAKLVFKIISFYFCVEQIFIKKNVFKMCKIEKKVRFNIFLSNYQALFEHSQFNIFFFLIFIFYQSMYRFEKMYRLLRMRGLIPGKRRNIFELCLEFE